MSSNSFKRFIQQPDSGAKKKERIRQEKKQVRKETQEYFAKKKEEAARFRAQGMAGKMQGSAGKKSGQDLKRGKGKWEDKERSEQYGQGGTRQGGKNNSVRPARTFKASGNKPGQGNQKFDSKGSEATNEGGLPLNKFIAHAGICSRREAAEMVKEGKVTVNGERITEPGFKVTDKDDVRVNGKKAVMRRTLVYILLNKPKDFITTTDDPQGRKTVLDIVKNATTERVYPVGRLDRNTTGVLLLTNDGDLAQKLSHPSFEIKKIYEIKLDKPLVKRDFDTILNGITLEDGLITPDALAYPDPKDKSVVGIEIHSGRNRIVRRIFEQLGYDVRNLDRVMYANLTKKNVERGKWRFLTEKEVRLLKFLNASFTRNKK